MSNFSFEPAELEVAPGTTVVWKDTMGKHSVKADDGSFESEILAADGEFKHTFETEGRYPFYCTLHGSSGGQDMAGVVVVNRKP
jgi:plastocyanin